MKRSSTLLTACLCAAGSASAAEWSAAPTVSWVADHDTNRNLSPDGEDSQSASLVMDLQLRRSTGAADYLIEPVVGFSRYTNDVAQSTNNQSLRALGTWRDERSITTAQLSASRDTNLNNEIADTGIATGSTERRAKSAMVGWTYQTSDNSKLETQASYSDLDYDSDRDFRLVGYRYPSVSLTETLRWSDRTSFMFSGYASKLISDNPAADSDSYGVTLGFNRLLTSHINLFLSAGLSRQKTQFSTESGKIGRFELTHVGLLTSTRLTAERSVAASAYGYLVTRDTYTLSVDRRLRPRWSTRLSLRSVRNDDLLAGFSFGSGERVEYDRAETMLAWKASRTIDLSINAAWTRAESARWLPPADGWRAALAATWTPRPRTMSR